MLLFCYTICLERCTEGKEKESWLIVNHIFMCFIYLIYGIKQHIYADVMIKRLVVADGSKSGA